MDLVDHAVFTALSMVDHAVNTAWSTRSIAIAMVDPAVNTAWSSIVQQCGAFQHAQLLEKKFFRQEMKI